LKKRSGEKGASGGWRTTDDQDRGDRRLVHQQPPLSDEYRRRHRERHHHGYLRRAHPYDAHQNVGDRETDDDPQGHLQGATAALAERKPQRDDGRHRREEGLLVAQDR
jgi:hypothetical protein